MKKSRNNFPLWATVLCSLLFFVVLSFFTFPKIIEGKKILQPDIVHYKGAIEEVENLRKESKEESYWTNSMFSGMPTYQMGARYSTDIVKKIDGILRFLPRPADYLFLLLSGFFLLGMVVVKDWRYALLGSILFSFSTYYFIIIAAGHNAKLHSIAYFAPLTAGVILLFDKKYVLGFLLFTLFMSLEIGANHPQMTYYLGLCLGIYVIIQLVLSVQKKETLALFKSCLLALFGLFIALGLNSSRLLTTYEYSKETIRGKSSVFLEKENKNEGLETEYITQWSYGVSESLNLLFPYFSGGGSSESGLSTKHMIQQVNLNIANGEEREAFLDAISELPLYWGDQPFTSGAAYQGITVFFLFFLAIIFVKNRYKFWLVSATTLSLLLAYGKNFPVLTDLFIAYFPLYNKFRAVSSILVIAEFTVPLLAIIGLYKVLNTENRNDSFKKVLYFSVAFLGFIVFMYLFSASIFRFTSSFDQQFPDFLKDAIRKDRVSLFRKDLIKSFVLIGLIAASLLVYLKGSFSFVKEWMVLLVIGILSFYDLSGVGKQYLNHKNFVDEKLVDYPFPTEITEDLYNQAIQNPHIYGQVSNATINSALSELKKKDKSHYRVYNSILSPFNETNTSYFHSSIGGYHGAKLRIYQDVIDKYLTDSINYNVLDMLNTKYILGVEQENGIYAEQNPNAKGNAWFVDRVESRGSELEEINALEDLDFKTTAVCQKKLTYGSTFDTKESLIELVEYKPNKLVYSVENNHNGFAVFSEIFYNKGWKAFIDGKESSIYRVNYLLRGLEVPSDAKEIVFEFKPESVEKGKKITLASAFIFILSMIVLVYLNRKQLFS